MAKDEDINQVINEQIEKVFASLWREETNTSIMPLILGFANLILILITLILVFFKK